MQTNDSQKCLLCQEHLDDLEEEINFWFEILSRPEDLVQSIR